MGTDRETSTNEGRIARALARAPRPHRRWHLFLLVAAVAIPIPAAAASGFALPLPSTVERLAESLIANSLPVGAPAEAEQIERPAGVVELVPNEPPRTPKKPAAADDPKPTRDDAPTGAGDQPDAPAPESSHDESDGDATDEGSDEAGDGENGDTGETGRGNGNGNGNGEENGNGGGNKP